MADQLIVNLEEFAELCGITAETMRVHIRTVDGSADWLIERGERGRGYKIEARGGVAWWRDKRDRDDLADAERRAQLQQLRFELTGGAVEEAETMKLSGRQRSEEYGAALQALKLREQMGELIPKSALEHELSVATVALRRRLQRVPGEFVVAQGLDAALVRPLKAAIGRALTEFVDAISVVEIVEGDHADPA